MAISLQADSTLPQGYILVDGQRVASVSTTGGLSANNISTTNISTTNTTTSNLSAETLQLSNRAYFTQGVPINHPDFASGTATVLVSGGVHIQRGRGNINDAGFAFIGDRDTGMFNLFPEHGMDNTLSFVTQGLERIRIMSDRATSIGHNGIYITKSGLYYGGGAAFWDGQWRNTEDNVGGWALRNTDGELEIRVGASPGVAGTQFTTFNTAMRIKSNGKVLIGGTQTEQDGNVLAVVNAENDGLKNVVQASCVVTGGVNSISLRPGNNTRTPESGNPSETGNVIRWGGNGTNANILQFRRAANVLIAQMDTSGVLLPNLAGTGNRAVFSNPSGYLTNSSSDNRLKENVIPVTNALDKVTNLNSVYYNWKDKEKFGTETNIGLIAQDVKDIVPELVYQNNDGMYGVHYDQVGPLLINAVKELKQQLDSALQRISELESN